MQRALDYSSPFCKIVHVWHTCWVLNDPNKIWTVHRISNMRGCPMQRVISAVAILLPFTPQKLVCKIISRVGLIKLNWNGNAEQKITNWILIKAARWFILLRKRVENYQTHLSTPNLIFWGRFYDICLFLSFGVQQSWPTRCLPFSGYLAFPYYLLYCTHLLLLESHFIIPIIIAYVPTILCWVCEA